jgi:hypothetical protein
MDSRHSLYSRLMVLNRTTGSYGNIMIMSRTIWSMSLGVVATWVLVDVVQMGWSLTWEEGPTLMSSLVPSMQEMWHLCRWWLHEDVVKLGHAEDHVIRDAHFTLAECGGSSISGLA